MNYHSEGMTHVDLFSGIGGFALAARWTGFRTVAFCERDAWCQRVLRKHWPDVPVYDDVRTFPDTSYSDVTLLTGGAPCQPFSLAGKRVGKDDDRYLWPEMFTVIKAVRPAWVIFENVPGIIGMALDTVLADLEGADYACWPVTIPACAVDAPHRRERVWVVANSNKSGLAQWEVKLEDANTQQQATIGGGSITDVADTKTHRDPNRRKCTRWPGINISSRWLPEPNVGRVANGVPSRVDRLRGLGNAIVPQVAAQLMAMIAGIRDDELPF